MGNNVVAFICARAGSKRLPGKNLSLLDGVPLIAHSIKVALNTPVISRVVVSTDSEEIRKVSLEFGAEAPFLRPIELSGDSATLIAVLQHAVRYLEKDGRTIDCIVLLQPTSPFRTIASIEAGINAVLLKGADAAIGLKPVKENPQWMRRVANDRVSYYLPRNKGEFLQSQDLEELFVVNGALYVCKRDLLMKDDELWNENTAPIIMQDYESIDIDEEADLEWARFNLMNKS